MRSAHGRVVVFNRGSGVYVHDRVRGLSELVGVSSSGKVADGESFEDAISADGRFVAFRSEATNRVPADRDKCRDADGGRETCNDVFVRDRLRHKTDLVSVSNGAEQGNGGSLATTISANGRFVAFQSDTANLSGRDTHGGDDVFVRDRVNKTTELVSVSAPSASGRAATGSFWTTSFAERRVPRRSVRRRLKDEGIVKENALLL